MLMPGVNRLSVSLSHLQEIFPVYFGSKYDATLEMLVWEFISRLEELLPVPDFTQVPCFFELNTYYLPIT